MTHFKAVYSHFPAEMIKLISRAKKRVKTALKCEIPFAATEMPPAQTVFQKILLNKKIALLLQGN